MIPIQIKRFLLISLTLTLAFNLQKTFADEGHFHSDSLQNITVSGTAIVDSSLMHALYYLDSDGDGRADYKLNFGPWWYKPDSGTVSRPIHGESILIEGGLFDEDPHDMQGIVVYKINDLLWRNPSEPTWNMMGGHQNEMGHHNSMGFAFGWRHDSLRTVELSGSVLADSTFIFTRFYLDTNADSLPDYFLNFGPPWYRPENNTPRPENGDFVRINGGLINTHDIPMLIVYTLNNRTWLDSSALGNHFGGGWIYNNMSEGRYFYSPFDSLDGMYVRPGWAGGMEHGHNGMMSDSLFCQILEVFPQNLPNHDEFHVLAGYEIAMFNGSGSNYMWMDGTNGGHMNMSSEVDYTLHYTDIQLRGEQLNENSIVIKYWDDLDNNWISVPTAVLNTDLNTITFSSKEVSNYMILSGTPLVTSIGPEQEPNVENFTLSQNYPNPFGKTTAAGSSARTIIRYTIGNNLPPVAKATLTVYNALGQKVAVLAHGKASSGEYRVIFNGKGLSTGVYYYELKIGRTSSVRKMLLIK